VKKECINCGQSLVTDDDQLICVEKLNAGKTEEESVVPDDGFCKEWN
jgi:hypothetical protein